MHADLPEISDDTCRIPLGRSEYFAIVDAEDYAFLTQWMWTFKRSAWAFNALIYARRHQRIEGVRTTILMHTLILTERMKLMRPSDEHTPDHINRDSLNNRQSNLRWATKAEQKANQGPVIQAADKAKFEAMAAA